MIAEIEPPELKALVDAQCGYLIRSSDAGDT
jgi:hypothetical protein